MDAATRRGPHAGCRGGFPAHSRFRPPLPWIGDGPATSVLDWGDGVSTEHVEARPGAYADSVTLMQASTDVRKADGVEAALIAMATELNLGLLAEMGFAAPAQAGPNDLLIAVRAKDDAALAGALAAVDTALAARPAPHDGAAVQQPPRTTAAAARAGGPG